ncbi:MAG: DUF2092 domain-containing protein [Thermodesulfobacteriota bacterium]|nr:DUF2092 domain-containing protein [Thermodesulfobacteriota bacterium]
MNTRNRYLSICVIAICLVAGSAFASDTQSQVFGMLKKVAEAKQYSVTIHMGYDIVQESGQKIEFSEIRKTTISRPNHLRVEARQSDGDESLLIFDGKVITLFNESENIYSQTDRPGDVDGAIRYAVGKMGMRVPLARMLTTTFPSEFQKMTTSVDYVEHNTLGATPTDHIAGQTEDIDFQVWITKDNLPERIVITYKNSPGQPQFQAQFSDWNLAPKISDDTFIFTPPKGAEKIPTLLPATESGVMNKTQGGS